MSIKQWWTKRSFAFKCASIIAGMHFLFNSLILLLDVLSYFIKGKTLLTGDGSVLVIFGMYPELLLIDFFDKILPLNLSEFDIIGNYEKIIYLFSLLWWIIFYILFEILFKLYIWIISKNIKSIICISFILILLMGEKQVYSYNVETHENITEAAFDLFSRENHEEIIFSNKLFTSRILDKAGKKFSNNESNLTIFGWLYIGATDEDNGERALNHFYNPINDEGLLLPHVVSSLIWAHISSKNVLRKTEALRVYGEACTETDTETRNRLFAQYYYSVGAFMHLTQDIGQPEHVRNDMHFYEYAMGNFGLRIGYENYCSSNIQNERLRSLVNKLGNSNIDLPFMSEQHDNTGDFWEKEWGTMGGEGLAQFTNREFFSPDSIFDTENFPHPGLSDINEQPDSFPSFATINIISGNNNLENITVPFITSKNLYLNDGGQNRPVRLTGISYHALAAPVGSPTVRYERKYAMNNLVYDDMFRVLVLEEIEEHPATVRNSAGVLHYFFPGWTINASALLSVGDIVLNGTIVHNKAPDNFKWNDISTNNTSTAEISFLNTSSKITIPLNVTESQFELNRNVPDLLVEYNLLSNAVPNKIKIKIQIGAEVYEKEINVDREIETIYIRSPYDITSTSNGKVYILSRPRTVSLLNEDATVSTAFEITYPFPHWSIDFDGLCMEAVGDNFYFGGTNWYGYPPSGTFLKPF